MDFGGGSCNRSPDAGWEETGSEFVGPGAGEEMTASCTRRFAAPALDRLHFDPCSRAVWEE